MTGVKLSHLPEAEAITGAEIVPVVQDGETRRTTADELRNATVPEIVIPPTIYGVEGRECNLYFDNIHIGESSHFVHDVTTPLNIGAHQNERWTWTPDGAMTSGNITVSAASATTGLVIASKSAQLRAAAANAGSGETLKVVVIGDSLVAAGDITQTLLDIAGGDVMGVELIGTKGSAPNLHEGRGGWTVARYTSDDVDNPFWFSGSFDFVQYLSANEFDAPDWVFINLGINDVFNRTSDAETVAATANIFNNLDTMIASFKAAGSDVRVGLMIPVPPARDQDAFGSSYGSGQTRWRFKRNILIYAREMIARYSGQEGERVYLVPTNTALDTTNNVRRSAEAPVNSRSSTQVRRMNNGVHPAATGYQQMSDALWAFMKCTL